MRNRFVLILGFLLVFSLVLSAGADKKLFFEAQGMFMFPSDGNFKDVYGSSVFYPRVKAGYKFGTHIYAFFGCGIFNITGETPVLGVEAKSKQQICLFAGGYEGDISEKMQFRLEAGAANFDYEEKAFGETVKGVKLGFYLGSSLVYNFSASFFATLNLGYLSASDTVESIDIKLGGIHTGIGIGIRI